MYAQTHVFSTMGMYMFMCFRNKGVAAYRFLRRSGHRHSDLRKNREISEHRTRGKNVDWPVESTGKRRRTAAVSSRPLQRLTSRKMQKNSWWRRTSCLRSWHEMSMPMMPCLCNKCDVHVGREGRVFVVLKFCVDPGATCLCWRLCSESEVEVGSVSCSASGLKKCG